MTVTPAYRLRSFARSTSNVFDTQALFEHVTKRLSSRPVRSCYAFTLLRFYALTFLRSYAFTLATPRASAIRTSSASDLARIFCMTFPR